MCEKIRENTAKELNNILLDEKDELLQIIKEKNERIAYLQAVIDAYEECTQKFANLVRKIGEQK